MINFKDTWHERREKKKSTIIAGLDPATFRKEYGLPSGVNKLNWSLAYIEAVAPYVVGIKLNKGYFQGEGDYEILVAVIKKAKELDLIILSDGKISDIGSTNDAWFFHDEVLGVDATTIAPYAGNIEDSIQRAHNRGFGVISMGLMSNPEFQTEMNYIHKTSGEPLWKNRVSRSIEAGVDGLVVGGTYTTKDSVFMEFVHMTKEHDVLYLVPGIGFQGGRVEHFLKSGIPIERCMLSSGRKLMFPNGPESTPEEQGKAAQKLRKTLYEK